ncbi:MAG: hypothetical protein KatS3mg008_0546 [Acidimicrobiales bacterium]|nr:MAG: hypothetical protein KatS3mg008_0546 [Acidimicrobiales bacterium]
MLFNSLQFAVFFVVVAVAYWTIRSQRLRQLLLLGASYFFYGLFDWRFLGLLVLSTAIDFTAARLIQRSGDPGARKTVMVAAVSANLGILGVFKYFDFFVSSAADLLGSLGWNVSPPLLEIAVPVGLSFYTFQSMSYTIDVYRGKITAEEDPIVFATYVAFFPQLAAGPIERAGDLVPQLRSLPERIDPKAVRVGLELVLLGLFRKVALADVMAPVVRDALRPQDAFGRPVEASWILSWVGVFAFMVQLYGDFAGYSTIARGLAKILGIDISRNFRRPLWSRSQQEFWQRWHVTLMNWFRDYVYYPLWRRRYRRLRLRGVARMRFALMVTFTLSGLWHGASWALVLWGSAAGGLLVLDHSLRRGRRRAAATSVGDQGEIEVGAGAVREGAPPAGDEPSPTAVGERGAATLPNRILEAGRVAVTIIPLAVLTVLLPLRSVSDAVDVWTSIITFGSGAVDGAALLAVLWGLAGLVVGDRHEIAVEALEEGRAVGDSTASFLWGLRVGMMVCALLVFSGGAGEPYFYFQF